MAYPRTHNLFGSHFCGLEIRQYWADLALWELFLNAHPDIQALVEMGTFKCGMSVFLKLQAAARGIPFWTFDRDRPAEMESAAAEFVELDSDFIHGDFWADTKGELLNIIEDALIKPILLFVDGGNKGKEFAYFVPFLCPGDYVAVHDYGTEFRPEMADPVADLLEPEFWDECLSPPQPCLTRFWRRV